ncbi:MAG: hypothetical protein R3Y29_07685, partial [bacterium]
MAKIKYDLKINEEIIKTIEELKNKLESNEEINKEVVDKYKKNLLEIWLDYKGFDYYLKEVKNFKATAGENINYKEIIDALREIVNKINEGIQESIQESIPSEEELEEGYLMYDGKKIEIPNNIGVINKDTVIGEKKLSDYRELTKVVIPSSV